MNEVLTPEHSELGKKSAYDPHYHPEKLFPIARSQKRIEIGVANPLPFYGYDLWNHYEVSWLNKKGKPVVALAQIVYGCETPNLIESKSMKLYFNSFNNTRFDNEALVQAIITNDIAERVGGEVKVTLTPLALLRDDTIMAGCEGFCLDELDIECSDFLVNPSFLTTNETLVEENLFSNLLKSNCLVTHQPDWGTVQIIYKGKQIDKAGLLRYIISFRNHNEFHEQCIERIYMDIMNYCAPTELIVYGRYTRRGGLDINPFRASHPQATILNTRLCRQ